MLVTAFALFLAFVLGPAPAADDYVMGPDSFPHDGVPVGRVTGPTKWKSEVFKGTERDYWVYVPAQYKPEEPACVMAMPSVAAHRRW